MAVATARLTRHARTEGYAVPAVNVFDQLSMRAVVTAAEALQAPLIVQVSVKTVRSLGLETVTSTFRNVTADSGIPVALHLDHCPDREVISRVVRSGWSSVLFDASNRDLATAERETAEVVKEAHAVGVDVESEIENIIGVEDGVGSDDALHSYSAAQLAAVGRSTGADLLAPQLGTSHGEYRARPRLLPERVRELAALTDLPIVLHGGTGLSAEEFQAFIDAGVSKINISTAVKLAYMKSAAQHLDTARERNVWDPQSFFRDIDSAVQAAITPLIEQFGAAGRAVAAAGAVSA